MRSMVLMNLATRTIRKEKFMVYYVSKRGCVVYCHRRYLTHAGAYKHFLNGTGDILGQRTITSPYQAVYYAYFVWNYKVVSNFSTFSQRQVFHGSSVQMEGGAVPLDLGSVILATFISRRKKAMSCSMMVPPGTTRLISSDGSLSAKTIAK
jgi:hypothetical protein